MTSGLLRHIAAAILPKPVLVAHPSIKAEVRSPHILRVPDKHATIVRAAGEMWADILGPCREDSPYKPDHAILRPLIMAQMPRATGHQLTSTSTEATSLFIEAPYKSEGGSSIPAGKKDISIEALVGICRAHAATRDLPPVVQYQLTETTLRTMREFDECFSLRMGRPHGRNPEFNISPASHTPVLSR